MTSSLPNGCAISGLSKAEGLCPVCGKSVASVPNGFAFLAGGALLQSSKHSATIDPRMEGFLFVGFHGAHGESSSYPSAQVSIADETPDGQFEIEFCSSVCLRQFLNSCVDQLEGKLSVQNDG